MIRLASDKMAKVVQQTKELVVGGVLNYVKIQILQKENI